MCPLTKIGKIPKKISLKFATLSPEVQAGLFYYPFL